MGNSIAKKLKKRKEEKKQEEQKQQERKPLAIEPPKHKQLEWKSVRDPVEMFSSRALHEEKTVAVHGYPDILGFKSVNFHFNENRKLNACSAILWLQIPIRRDNTVFSSLQPDQISVNALQRKTKYRTGRACVIGVQFYGRANDVKRAVLGYQQGVGYLASGHDPNFTYEVEKWSEVKGYDDIKQGCGKGIHFYTDFDSASSYSDYWKRSEYWPIITRKLSGPRPEVSAIVSQAYKDKYLKSKRERGIHGRTMWTRRDGWGSDKWDTFWSNGSKRPTDTSVYGYLQLNHKRAKLVTQFIEPIGTEELHGYFSTLEDAEEEEKHACNDSETQETTTKTQKETKETQTITNSLAIQEKAESSRRDRAISY